MSTPKNILKFNEVTGKVLAYLYEQFPKESVVDLKKLFPKAKIDNNDFAEPTQENREEARIVSASINFLIKTGYITGNVGNNLLTRGVLTAKGLELLKLTPDSLNNSFGDELVKATKSGVNETIVTVASGLLTSGLTLLYKTVLN